MKILMISNDFLPMTGGVANHIAELSKAMVRQEHTVRVLHLCYDEPSVKQENLNGVEVIRVAVTHNQANKQSKLSKLWRYIATAWRGSVAIKQQIKLLKPDVIHWHDFYHTSLAMRFVPFPGKKILTNHASGYLEQHARGGYWHSILRGLAKPADCIIGPSQELAEKSRILNKPCVFIANGVDIERFNSAVIPHREWRGVFPSIAKIMVAPRRLDPKNGLDNLIRAMPHILAEIPDTYLLIAGGGPQNLEEAYEKLAEALNIASRIKITGNLTYDVMPSIMALANLIVIPSRMEAVSLAALEAMACGKAVVASNVGGLPFVIDQEVGALVPPDNPSELARACLKLLKDEDHCKACGLAARQRVEQRFAWSKIAKETIQIYQDYS